MAGRQRLVPTGNIGPIGVFAFLEGRCLFTVSPPYIDTCTADFVAQAPPPPTGCFELSWVYGETIINEWDAFNCLGEMIH